MRVAPKRRDAVDVPVEPGLGRTHTQQEHYDVTATEPEHRCG